MTDYASAFFFVILLGMGLFFYDQIKLWIANNPIIFTEKDTSTLIISPYKRLFFYWRSVLPPSMWSFLYYSSLWEEPFFFVKLFGLCLIFNHIVMSFMINHVVSFFLSILIAFSFILAVMKIRSAHNRFLFAQSFPLVVNLMYDAVKSGMSLRQSFMVIVRESKGPIKKVFENILHGLDIGVSLDKVLRLEKENINHGEFSLLCSALSINNMTGGSLDHMLNKIKLILDNRGKFQQKMQIAIASSKADGWIVIGITFFLLGFILFANERAFMFFVHDPFGHRLLKILSLLLLCNIISVIFVIRSIKSQ